jgi:hypothetical protein
MMVEQVSGRTLFDSCRKGREKEVQGCRTRNLYEQEYISSTFHDLKIDSFCRIPFLELRCERCKLTCDQYFLVALSSDKAMRKHRSHDVANPVSKYG